MQTTETPAIAAGKSLPKAISLVATVVFFAWLIHILRQPFHSGHFWMEYTEDDFFYYLKVAQNIVQGHGSTFNGIVSTNGYHPLYEGLLVLVSKVTTSDHGILTFLALLTFTAAAVTYWLSVKLLRLTGVSLGLATALSMWVTLYALRVFYYGMEVSLAVPFALASLAVLLAPKFWTRNFWSAAALGLLFSFTILSRLDCLFLVAMLLLGVVAQKSLRTMLTPAVMAGVAAGLLPVLVYFVLNRIYFDTWLPISGMAKQLKTDSYPSRATWDGLYLNIPGFLIVLLPIPAALALLPGAWKRMKPIERGSMLACLCFPWVYYFILCCRSDWRIWGWYMYPLRLAIMASFFVFCATPLLRRWLDTRIVAGALMLAFLGFLFKSDWRIQLPDVYAAAIDLEGFEATHPGIYAMGDRSGSVGYLIHSPLVQLEGLMMDKRYLENVKQQRDLRTVMNEYGVRYYIGTRYEQIPKMSHGCFQAAEPDMAGPASPHMRSEFCEAPVFTVEHEGAITDVYDLHPKPGN